MNDPTPSKVAASTHSTRRRRPLLGRDGRRARAALGERRPGRPADPLRERRRALPRPRRGRPAGARLARGRPQQVDRACGCSPISRACADCSSRPSSSSSTIIARAGRLNPTTICRTSWARMRAGTRTPLVTRLPGWSLPIPAHRVLADDAVDAVRLVRAADALRQRGTTLRTAAGYEIFIDAETGQAVFSLRTVRRRPALPAPGRQPLQRRGGERPERGSDSERRRARLVPPGPVQLARSRRGRARRHGAGRGRHRRDVLGAFAVRRPSTDLPTPRRDAGSMRVELERPADEPAFAESGGRGAVARDEPAPPRADLRRRGSRERIVGRAGAVSRGDSASPRTATRRTRSWTRWTPTGCGLRPSIDAERSRTSAGCTSATARRSWRPDRRRRSSTSRSSPR